MVPSQNLDLHALKMGPVRIPTSQCLVYVRKWMGTGIFSLTVIVLCRGGEGVELVRVPKPQRYCPVSMHISHPVMDKQPSHSTHPHSFYVWSHLPPVAKVPQIPKFPWAVVSPLPRLNLVQLYLQKL